MRYLDVLMLKWLHPATWLSARYWTWRLRDLCWTMQMVDRTPFVEFSYPLPRGWRAFAQVMRRYEENGEPFLIPEIVQVYVNGVQIPYRQPDMDTAGGQTLRLSVPAKWKMR